MLLKRLLILTIGLCLTMLSTSGSVVAADMPSIAQIGTNQIVFAPLSPYIYSTQTTLSITTSGTATNSGTLIGIPGVTDQVWIYLYLEKYVNGYWTIFSSWSQYYNSYYGSLVRTASVPSGYYYRVRANYYAYSGDSSERTAQYSSTIYH